MSEGRCKRRAVSARVSRRAGRAQNRGEPHPDECREFPHTTTGLFQSNGRSCAYGAARPDPSSHYAARARHSEWVAHDLKATTAKDGPGNCCDNPGQRRAACKLAQRSETTRSRGQAGNVRRSLRCAESRTPIPQANGVLRSAPE